MDMLQRLSEITNTRKEKVFRKTVSLKNFVNKYANDNGFIMGNNKNSKYGDDSEYYQKNYMTSEELIEHDNAYKALFDMKENFGGFVADPNLNAAENGVMMNGKPSKFLYANVFDMDFSSLYPSIIRAFNLDKNTQIGKFFLIDSHIKSKLISEYGYTDLFVVSKNVEADMGGEENEDGEVTYDGTSDDIGTTLVDSIMSFDFVRIGEKYFDLPSTEDLVKELDEMKKNKA